MPITFSVAKNKFPDNVADSTTATNIKNWLDGLSITTVYLLQVQHVQGFWEVIVIYA